MSQIRLTPEDFSKAATECYKKADEISQIIVDIDGIYLTIMDNSNPSLKCFSDYPEIKKNLIQAKTMFQNEAKELNEIANSVSIPDSCLDCSVFKS